MDVIELVKRVQSGDKEAMGELYKTYSKHMIYVISHYVDDHEAVKDILHDGFLLIFQRINQCEDPKNVGIWMATIMKNLSVQYLKHLDVTQLLSEDYDVEDVPEFEAAITMEEIKIMIGRLPNGYRNVFRLAVLENKSHKEIARLLGISPGTSGSQLSRAFKSIRKMISEYRKGGGLILLILLLLLGIYTVVRHDSPSQPIVADDNEQPQPSGPVTNCLSDNLAAENSNIVGSTLNTISQPLTTANNGNIAIAPADTTSLLTFNEDEVFIACDTTGDVEVVDSLREPLVPPSDLFTDNFLADMNKKAINRLSGLNVSVGGNLLSCIDNRNFTPSGSLSEGGHVSSVSHTKAIHNIPITLSISVSKPLSSNLSLESGVQYTLLQTKVSAKKEYKRIQAQYIGLPLKVRLSLLSNGRFSLYGTTGAMVEFPVHGKVKTLTDKSAVTETYTPPVQWSTSLGVGIEYHLTPHIGIFAEPSVNYYFKASTPYPTIRQDRPCEINLPVGIRYNLH